MLFIPRLKWLMTSSLLLMSAPLYAATDSNWYFGLGAGNTWLDLPNSTQVFNGAFVPPPNNYDTYSIGNRSSHMAQLQVGHRWHEDREYLPYYDADFQYRHTMNAHIKGNVDQYSLPNFVNYNYELSYEADMFTLNGKADLIEYKHVLPYIAGGIGAIVNHVHDYNESPYPGITPRINPNFGGNTTTSLALVLGLGLDFILTNNVWATIGYDHVFQGDLKTGEGSGSWSNTALNIGSVKMDTIFINFTANFPQTFIY